MNMSVDTASLVEDAAWLLDCGENLHGIAARLGVDEQRLAARIHDHNPVLAQRLRATIRPPAPVVAYNAYKAWSAGRHTLGAAR